MLPFVVHCLFVNVIVHASLAGTCMCMYQHDTGFFFIADLGIQLR